MSNKIKRKITVSLNTQKSKTQTKTRPSVFDRLGIKAVAGSTTLKEYCHPWAQNGSCPYGKGCKYSKTHTLISPSKQRAAKIQTEPKKRHAKEGHKRIHTGEPENWDQWGPDELEDADPDDLERKRQELQRELELQMKMEHKARKKEKKSKKESSPSSDSSSSSSDSSTSSDESSSTSTSSLETKRKKLKKLKTKRASSSSSEGRSRKHKKTKRSSKSATRDKSKKSKPLSTKINAKSPSPVRIKKKSETPPIKPKLTLKKDNSETKSPRPLSRSSDRKEKHRTPSPKTSREKEREKEREREKEKEREREREREKEKEREREREREKEREKERERERERERAKQREKEREREKKKDSRSPKRDNRSIKDIKRRESPDSSHSKDRKTSPGRSKPSNASKRDRTPDRRDKRDERARSRGKDRILDKTRKDKRDSRDRERDRDRERERRLREEREAAREKEREEALARCQERQRERERLKELEKKESDRRGRDRVRRDDRGLDKPSGDRVERLLPLPEDRLPQGRRHSPERDRSDRRDGRGHSVDTRKSNRNSPDRHDRIDRELHDRSYDRERGYDREHDERSREYSMAGRIRDDRRLEDKSYDSPYDRNRHEERRYMEMDDHYEGPRDERMPLDGRDYVDDRRDPRRDMWDMRDERVDMERDFPPRGRGYGRPDVRPPGPKGRGDWVEPEYAEHEWDNRGRRPMDWENREGWDSIDRPHLQEDEWRHYDRGLDNWPPNDNRRRWPNNRNDWRDNRDGNSKPRNAASHNVEPAVTEDSNSESRRKETSTAAVPPQRSEPTAPTEPVDQKQAPIPPAEPEQESSLAGKRPAEDSPECTNEAKKLCSKPEPAPVLEDDLSEISDDADDILNRDEFIVFQDILEEHSDEPLQATAVESESQPSGADQVPSATASQKSQSPLRSPAKSAQKDDSIDGDNMDLDFEEISEDELDEESKVKGIGDALGVDWASLVADSRSRIKPMSSAKLRWEPHNILVNLGISVRLAGEDLVKDVLREHAEAEIKLEAEEKALAKVKTESVNINGIKQEIKEEPDDVFKEEPKEESKIDPDDLNISHPIAAVQVANQETQQIRRTLFTSVGPHRRALSARRDLMIRRHLCNLPINDAYVEAPKRHDPELFKIATQLFERCL